MCGKNLERRKMVRDIYPAKQVRFGKITTITLHRTYSTFYLPTFTKKSSEKRYFRNNQVSS